MDYTKCAENNLK